MVPAKIKLLHIIKSLGRGGAEMLLPETLKVHDSTRFEFHYIYFLPWKDQMVRAIQTSGGVVTCFPANNNIRLILHYRALIWYVRQNKIDLIHCHLPWAGLVGRVIYKLTGTPVLYTEHNKQERYHWVTRLLNRLTFSWQTAAIAVSGDVAESIKKNISVHVPVVEILNGVNTNSFQRDKLKGTEVRNQLNVPQNGIVVGTVAVFRFQKRLKEWLEVFSIAAAVNDNLYGIIVGDGPLKEEIVAHRKHLGLDHKVFMPGLQSEVRPWLSAMDIYLMTSVFEGLPIALLEAMSMECAICTTDAGGIKEVIRIDVDGMMVKVDEWDTLPDIINTLAKYPAKLQQLKTNARNRAMEKFSITTMTRSLEEVYKRFAKS